MPVELGEEEVRALRRKAQPAVLAAVESLGGEAQRPAIISRALEMGGFTESELTAPGPPAKLEQYPRRVEYELSWALTNLKKKGRLVNPRWSVWALPDAPNAPPIAAPTDDARLRELLTMPYPEYLRTPEWKETRVAALVRAGHSCALDVSHTERLEVHHRTYDRLGEELESDLIVLCHECHRRHHAATGRPRRDARPRESFPPPAPAASELAAPAPAKRSFLSRLLDR